MKKAELIALLIKIGVSKENAEKIAANTSDDSTEVFDIEALATDFKTNQIALLKNDPEIVESIQTKERAKQLDIFERKVKQTFGLTSEEIAGKKFEEIIALAKTKATVGTDKTTEELQLQIQNLTVENKRLMEEELPKVKGEVELHKKRFDIENKLSALIPSGEDKIRLPFDTVKKLVKMDIEEAYDVDLNDKGELLFKVKGTDLMAQNADKTKFLSGSDIINERLEHHKALVKSNAGNGGAGDGGNGGANGKVIDTGGGETKRNLPGLDKAKAHAESLKTAPNE